MERRRTYYRRRYPSVLYMVEECGNGWNIRWERTFHVPSLARDVLEILERESIPAKFRIPSDASLSICQSRSRAHAYAKLVWNRVWKEHGVTLQIISPTLAMWHTGEGKGDNTGWVWDAKVFTPDNTIFVPKEVEDWNYSRDAKIHLIFTLLKEERFEFDYPINLTVDKIFEC